MDWISLGGGIISPAKLTRWNRLARG